MLSVSIEGVLLGGGERFAYATPAGWSGPLVAGMLGRVVYPPAGSDPAASRETAPGNTLPLNLGGTLPLNLGGISATSVGGVRATNALPRNLGGIPATSAGGVPATNLGAGAGAGLPFNLGGGASAGAGLPFNLGGGATARPRSAIRLGPPLAPIAAAELRDLVAPAVVALVASRPGASTQLAAGVLTTASGLILTSRRAISNALAGGGKLAAVHPGPRGRFGAHELAQAVPARILEISDELDLALVEALPAQAVFYPHLPVARRSTEADTVLAVGHRPGKDRGLWSAALATLSPAKAAGTARWLREVTPGIAAGTPLVDGVGRVVALVTEPQAGAARAIDSEALLRFLVMGQAPARRFAGVPPFRRPSTLLAHPTRADSSAARAPAATPPGPLAGLVPTNAADQAMPGISDKGSLDRHLQAAEARAARRAPALEKSDAASEVSFDGPANVLLVTAPELERYPVPDVVKVDMNDAPERGPRAAWVTIVELGDFHAAETRLAEPAIRALVDGDDAQARLLWKDADRGDGAAYLLAARAARAAGEQDDFWSMHDRLLEGNGAKLAQPEDARRLAREQELDLQDFDTVMSGDGLANALETEGETAGRIPALGTPSFIVNGHLVDGGSVAGPALRAAVEEELALAAARAAKQPLDGVAAKRCRAIADGTPVVGTAFVPGSLAARVLAAAGRGEARARHPARH